MSLSIRAIRCLALAAACLLLSAHGGGAQSGDGARRGDDADKVYWPSQVDVKAEVKFSEQDIPSGQGCSERHGLMMLRAVLRKDGKVTDVEVRQKSGCEAFDRRAVKAAQKIRFKPAIKDGAPVSQYHLHQFTYNIW